MDHIVYVDAKSQEMEKILTGEKTMIVRSAIRRKIPYGRVERDDCLLYPFKFNRDGFNNMDDWLPVGKIEMVKG